MADKLSNCPVPCGHTHHRRQNKTYTESTGKTGLLCPPPYGVSPHRSEVVGESTNTQPTSGTREPTVAPSWKPMVCVSSYFFIFVCLSSYFFIFVLSCEPLSPYGVPSKGDCMSDGRSRTEEKINSIERARIIHSFQPPRFLQLYFNQRRIVDFHNGYWT